MRPIDKSDLFNWFSYHAPMPGQNQRYELIRTEARRLAEIILENSPPSPEQTVAIRRLREAIMYANAAIACNEKLERLGGEDQEAYPA